MFAGHGAKALIVARHSKDAEAAAQELSKGGAAVRAFAADVTRLSDMEAMAKTAVDLHGGLDVLCANAGIFPQARIEEMSPESWDDVVNTNLKGTLDDQSHVCRINKPEVGRHSRIPDCARLRVRGVR